jgi:hypothetical protein
LLSADCETEPFSTATAIATVSGAIAVVVVAVAGLLVYFKKRKQCLVKKSGLSVIRVSQESWTEKQLKTYNPKIFGNYG